jgi:hypothetical protein
VVLKNFFWLGDLWIVMELHWWLFLLLRLCDGCGLLDPLGEFSSANNNIMPTHGGAAACRRYGLGVEDEGHLKNLIVIFVLLRCFVLFDISLNARVLFPKKMITCIPNIPALEFPFFRQVVWAISLTVTLLPAEETVNNGSGISLG